MLRTVLVRQNLATILDTMLTISFAGWGSPFLFVILWTIISVSWVRRDLRREKELWRDEHTKSTHALDDSETQQTI